ncbi:hypothetical protein [Oscillatoria salina]|uniref:hypothetical protein n=1 Tax=Oscillatoria salina TaxID=331517 RepID=UPI0013BC2F48|nr:hypothetical protein [Oscillatoria salina]MBZ8182000.1 hypothetical protein [Oscillatoria salina IIICB1]NET89383.1 hypothetical protein [Kamptonema sp. SIO1D9]
MSKAINNQNIYVVDLAEGILVRTPIPSTNQAALRAGFAGYPVNPRWNPAKFHAWKIGRQWREAVNRGEMVVRSSDKMLVLAAEAEETKEEESSSRKKNNFFAKTRQKLLSYQIA